jgi:hypothetical protein
LLRGYRDYDLYLLRQDLHCSGHMARHTRACQARGSPRPWYQALPKQAQKACLLGALLPETSEGRERPARLSYHTADETSISHRSGPGCSPSRKVAGERWLHRYISLAKNVRIPHPGLSASHTFILHYGKVSGVFKLCWSRL